MAIRSTWITLAAVLFLAPSILVAQTRTPTPSPTSSPEATPEATVSLREDENCPALVEQALRITREGCEGTENNKVCYGHLLLDAVLRGGTSSENFASPGDRVDVIEVQNLSLSALDTVTGLWGVILMQIQAALQAEDDNNMTFIVFGDAALESAEQLIPVTVLQDSNVRETPSTSGSVITSVVAERTLVASGKTKGSDWLRIRLQDDQGNIRSGWIFAELVETELDLEALPVIDLDRQNETDGDPVNYGPMQAFYFSSGIDDAPCSAAPNSGMLIQTPEGQASVSLWIDEVVVELSATAFVQADANGDITINVLDGAARVTANGETRTAITGTSVSVPLNENLGAADVPNEPQPINLEDLQSLPTTLLDNPVEIPTPLNLQAGAPAPGSWLFSWGVETLSCPDGSEVTFATGGTPGRIAVISSGESIEWSGVQYARTGSGVYAASFVDANGNLHQDTLTVQALDRIAGLKVVDYASTICTLEVPFSLTLVGS